MKTRHELENELKTLTDLYRIDTNEFLDILCDYMSLEELEELVNYINEN